MDPMMYGMPGMSPYPGMMPPAMGTPGVNPAAMTRLQEPSSPLTELVGGGIQLGTQIMGFVVSLLGGLMQNGQHGGGGAPPVDGAANQSGGSGGSGGEAHSHGNEGGAAPVNGSNTSNTAGNSGGDVAPNASGTAFPVVGYQGEVGLHHGSSKGGADLMAPEGTPIVAMRGGTVESVGDSGAGGNSITIKGEDGLTYYYAHLQDKPTLTKGAQVRTGQQIGAVGKTGNAANTEPHLHLGIGHGIQNGTGPNGGTGSNFDANAYLKESLAAQRGQR